MRREAVQLPPADCLVERQEHVGLAQVAFVLGNLVFPDEMISEGVPRELANEAVILMGIVAAMGEYEVGLNFAAMPWMKSFTVRPLGRKYRSRKSPQMTCRCPAADEPRTASVVLGARIRIAAQDHPPDFDPRMLIQQAQHRSAAADFDVVRVAAADTRRRLLKWMNIGSAHYGIRTAAVCRCDRGD